MNCADCKLPMNREGGRWLHESTGKPQCERIPVVYIPSSSKWPKIENDPGKIEHLINIIGILETPMMPNTKEAVIRCLKKLHKSITEKTP